MCIRQLITGHVHVIKVIATELVHAVYSFMVLSAIQTDTGAG